MVRWEGCAALLPATLIPEGRTMETERESITQMRVRMYRDALARQREENDLAERETEQAKEAEAEAAKEPKGPESDGARAAAHVTSDKA
jgi:hypothetical protein